MSELPVSASHTSPVLTLRTRLMARGAAVLLLAVAASYAWMDAVLLSGPFIDDPNPSGTPRGFLFVFGLGLVAVTYFMVRRAWRLYELRAEPHDGALATLVPLGFVVFALFAALVADGISVSGLVLAVPSAIAFGALVLAIQFAVHALTSEQQAGGIAPAELPGHRTLPAPIEFLVRTPILFVLLAGAASVVAFVLAA